ncbi:STAS domain-containing protein [Streptomyces sp. NPDC094143]|uniref:STAS domain-containing protein n=1 Tax=Streptomyces sp. NPDC094143 TaxID=3155310 RepID=UPI00332BCE48
MTDTHGAARPCRLSAEHAVVDGIRLVTLRGEIDHDSKDLLTEVLLPSDGASSRIVADLSGVTFMDSSGINVFVAAHQHAEDTQGWVRIAHAQPSVLRVLQLVGLDQVIGCHPTTEEALDA